MNIKISNIEMESYRRLFTSGREPRTGCSDWLFKSSQGFATFGYLFVLHEQEFLNVKSLLTFVLVLIDKLYVGMLVDLICNHAVRTETRQQIKETKSCLDKKCIVKIQVLMQIIFIQTYCYKVYHRVK